MKIPKIPLPVFIFSFLLMLPFLVYSMVRYGEKWRIMKRWSVPWSHNTVWLTFVITEMSSIAMLVVLQKAWQFLGLQELRWEEGAKLALLKQILDATAELGMLFCLIKNYRPLPEGLFYWEQSISWRLISQDFYLKEPFNLQEGWLLWAVVGLICGFAAKTGISVAMDYFSARQASHQETLTDCTMALLFPMTGSLRVRLICLLIATAVLAPLVEEYMFRGFIMASMTQWLPTPVAVMISAVVFALAHMSPRELSQIFATGLSSEQLSILCFGIVSGFSYAQTRNLLTPLIIHSVWNITFLLDTLYKLRRYVARKKQEGYDVNELFQ